MTLHTDIPTRAELERLLEARDPGCISIYLPTSPITQEAQADRIELKNLAGEAARQLEASGADRRTAADVREALEDLVDDDEFWAIQARSLAVFASPSGLTTFRLPNRLTGVVEVADRFYVKPLLRAVTYSIYRALNSYPHLVEPGIPGNPDDATDADLAVAARTVLDEVYARELAAIRDRFELRFSHGRASADLATVARAATYGAVDTLVVDIDEKVPGYVDEDTGAVELAADDASSYGVVDEIARRALLAGGRVLAVRAEDVPSGGQVAAILRYAL